MSSLSIEGWRETDSTQKSTPLEQIHFYPSGVDHPRLEQAEVHLQKTHEPETMVDVDMATLDLKLPSDFGHLSDCKLRAYLCPDDQRGQFHLVGHRASDGSLIYTNAVLIDQLL
jgi:hypothetical protein